MRLGGAKTQLKTTTFTPAGDQGTQMWHQLTKMRGVHTFRSQGRSRWKEATRYNKWQAQQVQRPRVGSLRGQRGTGRDGGGEGSSQGAPFMLGHRASLRSTQAVRAERRVSYRPTSRSARTAPPPASSAAGAAPPAVSSVVAAGSSIGSDWGPGAWDVPEGTAAFCPWLTLTLSRDASDEHSLLVN